MNKYKYKEPKNSLDNRISAHSDFSDFNLHNWILSNFDIKKDDNVFDIGCGNGNYTELFFSKTLENGIIYGIDKNQDLIDDANGKYGDFSKNINFEVVDYDLVDNIDISFDWVFSIYSLYYTSDSELLVKKIKKNISSNGKFVVIGPASSNALDLDDFHFKLVNKAPKPEHRLRNKRIQSEFYPLFKSIFGSDNVSLEVINSTMTFPSIGDYAEYYWSTLLWREGIEDLTYSEIECLKKRTLSLLSKSKELKISKQMSCLIGNNK